MPQAAQGRSAIVVAPRELRVFPETPKPLKFRTMPEIILGRFLFIKALLVKEYAGIHTMVPIYTLGAMFLNCKEFLGVSGFGFRIDRHCNTLMYGPPYAGSLLRLRI